MDPFIVKPYLQLGDAPGLADPESVVLMWHAADEDMAWAVEVKRAGSDRWVPVQTLDWRRVAVATIEPHRVYRAVLSDLAPGAGFDYRVRGGQRIVFTAQGQARKAAGQSYRVVIVGDCGFDSPGQRAVAYQVHRLQPDLVFIPGDIIYMWGRIAEYRQKFYPIYNADQASPGAGAPLLRSTLHLAGLGEHDTGRRDVDEAPDSLGYYLYWSLPLNGPATQIDGPNTFVLHGDEQKKKDLLAAAAHHYPRMANYAFDFGNAHWTVLDTNRHVDWRDPQMRDWLKEDLAAAGAATWKFVGCYLPPFNSSREYPHSQRMRAITDLLEGGGVDIVFNGYVHCYQRTRPLTFKSGGLVEGDFMSYEAVIDGDLALDRRYDGRTRTRPEGILYVTTGAGGARLHDGALTNNPSAWQDFTEVFIADTHSFTVMDVAGSTLTVRQISETGQELDRFIVTKS